MEKWKRTQVERVIEAIKIPENLGDGSVDADQAMLGYLSELVELIKNYPGKARAEVWTQLYFCHVGQIRKQMPQLTLPAENKGLIIGKDWLTALITAQQGSSSLDRWQESLMESSGYWIVRQCMQPKQIFLWRKSILEVLHVMRSDQDKDLEVDKVNEEVAKWLATRKHPVIDLETYSYVRSVPMPTVFTPLAIGDWLKSLDAHSSRGRNKPVAKALVAAPPERKAGRCWKCHSQQHRLGQCPQATEEEKAQIYRDKMQRKREAAATLKIQDHYVRVLFDPGNSAASLCSPNVMRLVGEPSISSRTVHIVGVQGIATATDQSLKVSLSWKNKKLKPVECFVVEGLPYDVVLSYGDLGAIGAVVNAEKHWVNIRGVGRIPFGASLQTDEATLLVRLSETMNLKPGLTVIQVEGLRRKPWRFVPRLKRLAFPEAGGQAGSQHAVAVVNESKEDVVLSKDTVLGEMLPLRGGVEVLATVETRPNPNPVWTAPSQLFDLMPDIKAWEGRDTRFASQLKELIWRYRDVFQQDLRQAGQARFQPVKLELNGMVAPVRCYPYPASPADKDVELQYLTKMVEAGVITRGRGLWSSPFLLVKKHGTDKLRPVVNFAKLNTGLKYEIYALPRIAEVLQELGGFDTFSTLDATEGFFQIPLEEEAQKLCGVSTHFGSYVYQVLPMGLHLSTSVFEDLMEETLGELSKHRLVKEHGGVSQLSSLLGNCCRNMVDDIAIYSKGPEQGLKHLEWTLERMRLFNWKVKPSKARLVQGKLKLLGHEVSGQGIHMDPEKLKAMRERPEPTNKEEVRSVTQMFAWYRPFIKNFATLIGPMNELCKKGVPWNWSEHHAELYRQLKEAMARAPVLAYPNWSKEFELLADASSWAVGGMLGQRDEEGKLRPITYCSYWLPPEKRRWGATDRELEAIRMVAQHNRPYLRGRRVKVGTDHQPAVSLVKKGPLAVQSARRQSILTDLQEFDLAPYHVAGKSAEMKLPDTLSRIPGGAKELGDDREDREPTDKSPDPRLDPAQMAEDVLSWYRAEQPVMVALEKDGLQELTPEAQQKDEFLTALRALAEEKPLPKGLSKNKRAKLMSEEGNTVLMDDLLWRSEPSFGRQASGLKRIPSPEGVLQLWLTEEMLERVIASYHNDGLGGGHLGVSKTLAKVRAKYYALGLNKAVTKYVQNCRVCAEANTYRHAAQAPLKPMPQTARPNQRVGMDLVGPLPATKRGNRWILTMEDFFTKSVVLVALPNALTETVAEALFSEWICLFSCPEELLSDRGANFLSSVMMDLNKLLLAKKLSTTPYHPQCNGLVERSNATVASILRKFCDENQLDWDVHIKPAQFSINTMPSEATKVSPFQMTYGRLPRLPIDLALRKNSNEDEERGPKTTFVKQLADALSTTQRLAINNAKIAAGKMKEIYDKHAKPPAYQVGDLVYVKASSYESGLARKLQTKYLGPYKVVEVLNEGSNLKLEDEKGQMLAGLINAANVKPFYGEFDSTGKGSELVDEWKELEKSKAEKAIQQKLREQSKEERDTRKKAEKVREKMVKLMKAKEEHQKTFEEARMELRVITSAIRQGTSEQARELQARLQQWLEKAGPIVNTPAKLRSWHRSLDKAVTLKRLDKWSAAVLVKMHTFLKDKWGPQDQGKQQKFRIKLTGEPETQQHAKEGSGLEDPEEGRM